MATRIVQEVHQILPQVRARSMGQKTPGSVGHLHRNSRWSRSADCSEINRHANDSLECKPKVVCDHQAT